MEQVHLKFERAKIKAKQILHFATTEPGHDGPVLVEPALLLLGKGQEVENALVYVLMLLSERGHDLEIKEQAKKCACRG